MNQQKIIGTCLDRFCKKSVFCNQNDLEDHMAETNHKVMKISEINKIMQNPNLKMLQMVDKFQNLISRDQINQQFQDYIASLQKTNQTPNNSLKEKSIRLQSICKTFLALYKEKDLNRISQEDFEQLGLCINPTQQDLDDLNFLVEDLGKKLNNQQEDKQTSNVQWENQQIQQMANINDQNFNQCKKEIKRLKAINIMILLIWISITVLSQFLSIDFSNSLGNSIYGVQQNSSITNQQMQYLEQQINMIIEQIYDNQSGFEDQLLKNEHQKEQINPMDKFEEQLQFIDNLQYDQQQQDLNLQIKTNILNGSSNFSILNDKIKKLKIQIEALMNAQVILQEQLIEQSQKLDQIYIYLKDLNSDEQKPKNQNNEDSQQPSIQQAYFDDSFKSSQTINFSGQSVYQTMTQPHNDFALISPDLPHNQLSRFALKITLRNNGLIFVGIGMQQIMKQNKYYGLGYLNGNYLISSNQYVYHHSLPQYNNQQLSFLIRDKDIILVEFDPIQNILRFKNISSQKYFEMSLGVRPKNDKIHGLVVLQSDGGYVEMIEEVLNYEIQPK